MSQQENFCLILFFDYNFLVISKLILRKIDLVFVKR